MTAPSTPQSRTAQPFTPENAILWLQAQARHYDEQMHFLEADAFRSVIATIESLARSETAPTEGRIVDALRPVVSDIFNRFGSLSRGQALQMLVDAVRSLPTEKPAESPRWKEIDELCEGRSKIDLAEIILRERAARTETAATWIPVSERQPEGSKEVLTCSDGRFVSTRGARWVRELWAEAQRENIECAITHWMPMPEAPK